MDAEREGASPRVPKGSASRDSGIKTRGRTLQHDDTAGVYRALRFC